MIIKAPGGYVGNMSTMAMDNHPKLTCSQTILAASFANYFGNAFSSSSGS